MLRWCQSTVRILDRVGAGIVSTSRCVMEPMTRHRVLIFCRARVYSIYATRNPPNTSMIEQNTRRALSRAITQAMGPNAIPHACDKSRPPISGLGQTHVESIPCAQDERPTVGGCPIVASSLATTNMQGNAHNRDSLMVFKSFLSPPTLLLSERPKLTACTLISLYQSLKAESQLNYLSSKELTELVALLGTLSLPSPRNPCIYLSRLLPLIAGETTSQTYWHAILDIAMDKERLLRQTLNGTDRYWIMRAQLAQVVNINGPLQPGMIKLFK